MRAADVLASERAAGQRLVDDLRAELAGIIAEQQVNPPDDEHDVEGSSVGYERARVAAMLAHAEARLAEVDAAVGRTANRSSPGHCQLCGEPIGDDRLAALPTTGRCVSCAGGGAPGKVGTGISGHRRKLG